MIENIYYTGIGARSTPGKILKFYDNNPLSALRRWGSRLGNLKLILRSGAANGADKAFEYGCDESTSKKEIYLPWKNFNDSDSKLYYIPPEAYDIAGDIYGATWKFQKQSIKNLMARNMMQVMGIGLDEPSKFLLCWTPDGCISKEDRTKKTGGTGQAIVYADEMNIPIFNFNKEENEQEFIDFLIHNLSECGINPDA